MSVEDIGRKKTPSLLKRDESGQIDQSEAAKTTQALVQELITTERDFQKDISYAGGKGERRDVVFFVTVWQRNSIDGKVVLTDDFNPKFQRLSPRDPYKYREFDFIESPILVKDQPMRKDAIGRQMFGVFKVLSNYLHRMGVFE